MASAEALASFQSVPNTASLDAVYSEAGARERLLKRFATVLIYSLAAIPAFGALSSPRFFASDLATRLSDPSSSRVVHMLATVTAKLPLVVTAILVLVCILLPAVRVRGLWLGVGCLMAGPVASMFLSDHPGVKVGRLEFVGLVFAATRVANVDVRWMAGRIYAALRLYLYGSLVAVIVAPGWAVQRPYDAGFIPLLHSRLHGLAPHANVLGALLCVMLLLLPLVARPTRAFRAEVLLLIGLLIWTQSKTSLLAAAFGACCFLAWRAAATGAPRRLFAFYVGSGLALLGIASGAASVSGRLVSAVLHPSAVDRAALTGRPAIWAATVAVWQSNKTFGYGLSLWDVKMRLAELSRIGFPSPSAHSQFYQSLGESGLVGLIGLLAYLVIVTRISLRLFEPTHGVLFGLIGADVLRCFTEVPLRTAAYDPFFFVHYAAILLIVSSASGLPMKIRVPAAQIR